MLWTGGRITPASLAALLRQRAAAPDATREQRRELQPHGAAVPIPKARAAAGA